MLYVSAPIAPKQSDALISVKTTSAVIRLDSWLTNGCPIKYFTIKYKSLSKLNSDWTVVSAQVSGQQKSIELIDLIHSNWYSLNVMAVSDAGNTDYNYNFATLNPLGGMVLINTYQ